MEPLEESDLVRVDAAAAPYDGKRGVGNRLALGVASLRQSFHHPRQLRRAVEGRHGEGNKTGPLDRAEVFFPVPDAGDHARHLVSGRLAVRCCSEYGDFDLSFHRPISRTLGIDMPAAGSAEQEDLIVQLRDGAPEPAIRLDGDIDEVKHLAQLVGEPRRYLALFLNLEIRRLKDRPHLGAGATLAAHHLRQAGLELVQCLETRFRQEIGRKHERSLHRISRVWPFSQQSAEAIEFVSTILHELPQWFGRFRRLPSCLRTNLAGRPAPSRSWEFLQRKAIASPRRQPGSADQRRREAALRESPQILATASSSSNRPGRRRVALKRRFPCSSMARFSSSDSLKDLEPTSTERVR